ncbi:hypothetical protein ACOME3_006076 [Neoechinorhynchus agilis]
MGSTTNSIINVVTFGLYKSTISKNAIFEYLFSLVCLSQLDEIRQFFDENLEPLNEARKLKMIKEILDQEDEEKANGMTLFMYAAFYGKTEICRYFLQFDPHINHLDVENRNALYHSVRGGSFECTKLLLEQPRSIGVNKQTVSKSAIPKEELN